MCTESIATARAGECPSRRKKLRLTVSARKQAVRSRTALNPFLTYPVYDFSIRQFLEGLRACSDRAWRPHNLEPLKRTLCDSVKPTTADITRWAHTQKHFQRQRRKLLPRTACLSRMI